MDWAKELLGIGLKPDEMNVLQVCMRAVVMFFATLIIVRMANRRFLSKLAPLDVILGFILASMLARAINGSGPLLESIAAGFVLIILHRVLAAISFRSDAVGRLIKGEADTLFSGGRISHEALRAHNISEKDLMESVRLNGSQDQLEGIEKLMLERDGTISVVKKKQ